MISDSVVENQTAIFPVADLAQFMYVGVRGHFTMKANHISTVDSIFGPIYHINTS